MKTQKIIKKFREIGLTTKITIQDINHISVHIEKNRLDDPDLERILKAFPTKKFNLSIKTNKDNLCLEISKVPQMAKMKFPSFPPLRMHRHYDSCGPRFF